MIDCVAKDVHSVWFLTDFIFHFYYFPIVECNVPL